VATGEIVVFLMLPYILQINLVQTHIKAMLNAILCILKQKQSKMLEHQYENEG
jgi:hypothetical protein